MCLWAKVGIRVLCAQERNTFATSTHRFLFIVVRAVFPRSIHSFIAKQPKVRPELVLVIYLYLYIQKVYVCDFFFFSFSQMYAISIESYVI